MIDHIDRDKSNNKINNLREVTNECNQQNCEVSKTNKSGVTGVCRTKIVGKWYSYITVKSITKHLGSFENLDDAVLARYKEELNNPDWTCSNNSSSYKYLKENNLLGDV